jgi:hypothetical protein
MTIKENLKIIQHALGWYMVPKGDVHESIARNIKASFTNIMIFIVLTWLIIMQELHLIHL